MPSANIIFIINTELKPEIANAIKLSSEHFGTDYIELCGIDKQSGHPTVKGMLQIKEQVKKILANS